MTRNKGKEEIILRIFDDKGFQTGYETVGYIVRCKDCKYYSNHDKRCTVWNHGIDSNGYCHKGERRDDGSES